MDRLSTPLEGIRVVDLTHTIAGPYCAMVLGDLGADVIKVEPLGGDSFRMGTPIVQGVGYYFLLMNRNKRSLALDIKSEGGREVLFKLLAKADVFLENFKPGTAEKLGLGYDDLSSANPRLVYGSISGFGQTGPYRDRPAYDLILQGMGGLLSYTRDEGGKPRVFGIPLSDLTAGANAVQGVLAALFARERDGRGQHVDIALMDSAVNLSSWMAGLYFGIGHIGTFADKERFLVPYGIFTASDDDFVMEVNNDRTFARLCTALERPEWAEDERFLTKENRKRNRDALLFELNGCFATRPAAHWIELLNAATVPAGPIWDASQMLNDPQVLSRGMVEEVEYAPLGKTKILGTPLKLSRTPAGVRRAPPQLGEHTDEILGELGYERSGIDALRTAGVVA